MRPAKGGQAQNRVPQGLWVQVPPPALVRNELKEAKGLDLEKPFKMLLIMIKS